jgi:hypothetical protein
MKQKHTKHLCQLIGTYKVTEHSEGQNRNPTFPTNLFTIILSLSYILCFLKLFTVHISMSDHFFVIFSLTIFVPSFLFNTNKISNTHSHTYNTVAYFKDKYEVKKFKILHRLLYVYSSQTP